jgi:hypothetical protein
MIQHNVVRGIFSLFARTRSREPDERIEPTDRAGQQNPSLSQQIASLDVGQFVQETNSNSFLIPIYRGSGKYDDGTTNTKAKRHPDFGQIEAREPTDVQIGGEFLQQTVEPMVCQGNPGHPESTGADISDAQTQTHDDRARAPHKEPPICRQPWR